jgi:imidazolonepropionase-like amidohydrolase
MQSVVTCACCERGAALSRIGARADLIAVDGNPLADISLLDGQGEHITHIMKDGVFYKRL